MRTIVLSRVWIRLFLLSTLPFAEALAFERRRSYLPVGVDAPGKKNIEGLLPDRIRTEVYGENPDLVQALTGTTEERKAAHQKLKVSLLERFKKEARPGEDYEKLYEVARVINKALSKHA